MECMQERAKNAITPRAPSTVTLRGLDLELRSALDAEATRVGMSLNALILQTLRGSFGVTYSNQLFHDLDDLAGAWSTEEAEEFDAAVQFFEEIDLSIWRDSPDGQ